MLSVSVVGWSALAVALMPSSPAETVTGRTTVVVGADTNAAQSSDRLSTAGAAAIGGFVDYTRGFGRSAFGQGRIEVDLDLFSRPAGTSRAGLSAHLTFGRFLMGAGRVRRVGARSIFPRLRLDGALRYGLALRIDGATDPEGSVWTRAAPGIPVSEQLPDRADDDVLDPDLALTGPNVAFLRPLHVATALTRLRFEPYRRTRLEVELSVERVLQAGEPGAPRRHYLQFAVAVTVRQRIVRWLRLEASYQYERRFHDERRDREAGLLVLSTHRTEAVIRFRWRRWRLEFEHDMRIRAASGNGSRTHRHAVGIALRRKLSRTFAVIADASRTHQIRLDRDGRDWTRFRGGIGVEVRY